MWPYNVIYQQYKLTFIKMVRTNRCCNLRNLDFDHTGKTSNTYSQTYITLHELPFKYSNLCKHK